MRESVKKVLLAIPAAAGAVILAAVAVSPDVAGSNLEKWARVIGVWVPSWVTDTRTAVAAVVIIFLFYLWLFRERIPFELRRKTKERTDDKPLPTATPFSPTVQDQIGQYFLNKALAHDRYLEHEKENQERKVKLYATSLEGVTVTGEPSVQAWGNPDGSVTVGDTPEPISGEGSVTIGLATSGSGSAVVSGGGDVTASGEKSSEEARPTGTATMIREILTDIHGGSERIRRRYDAALKAIQEIGHLLSNQTLTPEERNTKAEQVLIDFWDKAITITGHEPTVFTSYAGFPAINGVVQFPDEIPPPQSDSKPAKPDTEG